MGPEGEAREDGQVGADLSREGGGFAERGGLPGATAMSESDGGIDCCGCIVLMGLLTVFVMIAGWCWKAIVWAWS